MYFKHCKIIIFLDSINNLDKFSIYSRTSVKQPPIKWLPRYQSPEIILSKIRQMKPLLTGNLY